MGKRRAMTPEEKELKRFRAEAAPHIERRRELVLSGKTWQAPIDKTPLRYKATVQDFEQVVSDSLREWLRADPQRDAAFSGCTLERNIVGGWQVELPGHIPLIAFEVHDRERAGEIDLSAWPMTGDADEQNALIADCFAALIRDLDERLGPDLALTTATRQSPKQETRGRRGYGTKAEKRQAVLDWDNLNPDTRPRLDDWLDSQFSSNPITGALRVPPSTFQGWRKYL